MDPITAAILGGAALGGSALTSGFNFFSQWQANRIAQDQFKKSMRWQKEMYYDQKAWQTEMANTAHQREVDDLRAAGLNPILSATGGNGADTPAPSVSNAPSSNAQVRAAVVGNVLNSAVDAFSKIMTVANDTKRADADASLAESQKTQIDETLPEKKFLLNYQGRTEMSTAAKIEADTDRIKRLLPYEIDLSKAKASQSHASAEELYSKRHLVDMQSNTESARALYYRRKADESRQYTDYLSGKANREIWQLANGSAQALSDMVGSFLPAVKGAKLLKTFTK